MKQSINKDPLSINLISVILVLGLIFICSSAYCQEDCQKDQPAEDKWQFTVTPYFQIASPDVYSTIQGQTAAIDIDFSDLLDNFDVLAFTMRSEARKGKWGFLFDGMYIDLDGDFKMSSPILQKVNVDIEQADVWGALMYRVIEKLPMKGCYLPLSLDVYGGARYAYLKQKITPQTGNNLTPELGKSKDWVEPLVGARFLFCLTKKLTWTAQGDIGGFGIGSASDRTWNFATGFDYRMFEKVSLKLAYRVYDIEYSNGSGTEKFGLDGKLQGPWLGMTFHF